MKISEVSERSARRALGRFRAACARKAASMLGVRATVTIWSDDPRWRAFDEAAEGASGGQTARVMVSDVLGTADIGLDPSGVETLTLMEARSSRFVRGTYVDSLGDDDAHYYVARGSKDPAADPNLPVRGRTYGRIELMPRPEDAEALAKRMGIWDVKFGEPEPIHQPEGLFGWFEASGRRPDLERFFVELFGGRITWFPDRPGQPGFFKVWFERI
jgi:hypothetical protein